MPGGRHASVGEAQPEGGRARLGGGEPGAGLRMSLHRRVPS